MKKDPESYLTIKDDQPSLNFDDIGPVLICDILKSMDPKKSKDMDGISLDLLKSIDSAIAKPLAHIFNLSLKKGIFPERLNPLTTKAERYFDLPEIFTTDFSNFLKNKMCLH